MAQRADQLLAFAAGESGDHREIVGAAAGQADHVALAVDQVRDILTSQTTAADGMVTAIDLPKSNVLAFDLANGSRVLARPSGTEPKIKFYFEVRSTLGDDEPLAAGEARAEEALDALQADFLAQAGVA